jgi:hypothetical protein
MDAVDDQVHVRVFRIVVRDDQGLVFLQAQLAQHGIGNPAHALPVHRIARIEGDDEMIDRPLRADG